MKTALSTILTELINGRLSGGKLGGGLGLQFKAADAANPESRLAAVRVGVSVGATELVTLRRELERLMPGTTISLDDEQSFTGRDEKTHYYRVFRWRPTETAVQAELLHVERPITAVRRMLED